MTPNESRALTRCIDARNALVDAERSLYDALATARTVGLSWAQIGDVLGVSKQAVSERYGRLNRVFGTGDQQQLPT